MANKEMKKKEEERGYAKALRVNLSDSLTEEWEKIKKYYGPESDSDMLRFLIRKIAREVKEKKNKEITE